MLDLSFIELAVIAGTALLIIKPEEWPGMLRSAGKWLGKLKRASKEFSALLQGDELVKTPEITTITGDDGNTYPAYKLEDALPEPTPLSPQAEPHTPLLAEISDNLDQLDEDPEQDNENHPLATQPKILEEIREAILADIVDEPMQKIAKKTPPEPQPNIELQSQAISNPKTDPKPEAAQQRNVPSSIHHVPAPTQPHFITTYKKKEDTSLRVGTFTVDKISPHHTEPAPIQAKKKETNEDILPLTTADLIADPEEPQIFLSDDVEPTMEANKMDDDSESIIQLTHIGQMHG